MQGFFEQVLRLARELGAPGSVAVDGTKIKANASKHKAMSYGRMRDKQRQLRDEVRHLLAQAEAVDAAEDAAHGPDRRAMNPAELQRRESRLARIREAKRAGGPGEGRGDRRRRVAQHGKAGLVVAIQLHRSGVADHEGARWIRPGLQRAGRR